MATASANGPIGSRPTLACAPANGLPRRQRVVHEVHHRERKEIERQTAALEDANGKDVRVAGRSSLAEAPHLANEPPLGVGDWLNRQAGQPG